MMVPNKFGKGDRRYLALVMSVVFVTAASPPIKAQPLIPLLSQSSTPATPSPSEAEPSRQAFGGQLSVFVGHEKGVNSAVFSPDGTRILTASGDKTARLWDNQGNLLVVLSGHEDGINSAVFSPDGNQILTASSDNTARLWDTLGNLRAEFRGHENIVDSAVFSPDGRQILTTSSWDGTIRLWDTSGKLLTGFRAHENGSHDAVFSPDGSQILTADGDNTARLWDISGKLIAEFRGHENIVSSAVFSPNGNQVLTASWDKTARLWDHQGNLLAVFQGHEDVVSSAVFSPDGSQILTGGYDTIRYLDISGNLIAEFQGFGFGYSVQLSPNGQQILTTDSASTARLWDISAMVAVQTAPSSILQAFEGSVAENNAQLLLFSHENTVLSAIFSPYGRYILTTSSSNLGGLTADRNDKIARLWNTSGELITEIRGYDSNPSDVIAIFSPKDNAIFSPDERNILTIDQGTTARLWDTSGSLVAEFQGHSDTIISAVFSPDGNQILTASEDGTARLWDISGNLLVEFQGHEYGYAVRNAVFSPNGNQILTASPLGNARLWDTLGKLIAEFQGDENFGVNSAIFSPDGTQILTTDEIAGIARLWDISGNILAVLSGHGGTVTNAVFSPDGNQILTGSSSDRTVYLWNTSGNLLAELQGHEYGVAVAKFSPDGRYILTADIAGTVHLWSTSGNVLAEFRGHLGQIESAEFSPDSSLIITAGIDKTTRLWNVSAAITAYAEQSTALQITQSSVSDQNAPRAEAALQAAIQLNQQGTVESRQLALQKLDEALNLYRADNNLAKAAHTLRLIGNIHTDLGQFQAALYAYNIQALPLSQQAGDRAEEAAILNSLGQLYTDVGNPEAALEQYNQALPLVYQLNDRVGTADTFNNIGNIQADNNDWKAALDSYTQALIISRPIGELAAEATALSNIGSAYIVLDDWGTALNAYQQALIITRYLNDKTHESSILNQMGKIYAALGDNTTALEHYNQALLISRAIGNRLGEASILSNLARFYEDQKNPSVAVDHYQQSIAITESIQGEIQIEELQSSFASERIDPYSRLINLLGAQGNFTAAFNYAERAKARAFLNQIANGRIDFQAGVDAQLLQQEQDLNNQMAATQRQLIALRSQPQDQRDIETIAETDARLIALQQNYANLRIQIKLQSPATASLVSVDVAPLEEIQSLLEPDTTLVEYFVTGDRTFAFVLTRDSFNTVLLDIRREDLVETITLLRDFPDLSDEIPPELQQLHQVLIEPLQPYLNTTHLIIVPHDILHYLPFAALTDGDRYLNDDYVVSLLPSANTLRYLPEPHDLAQPTLLALGNPVISESLSSLRYAEEEVEAIARLFNTQPLIRQAATESAVRLESDAASILHLAVHGEYDPINSLFSRLHLAADDDNDGRLEVREIYGLDLTQSTNLVVLSACQTSIGQQSRGDEIVGLNRAFLYAGAPAVLSSLWNVDDAATAMLMEQFYNHLRDGSDPATALQQAQQAIRQDPRYVHPYFWSAFSITGRAEP